jgi:hypothetical protein
MSALSDTLTVSLVLVLLFGSIALYLYTRIQQAEQKINLLESILLDIKLSAEVKDYAELPAQDMVAPLQEVQPSVPSTQYSKFVEDDEDDSDSEVDSPIRQNSPVSAASSVSKHSIEQTNEPDVEFYKSVIENAVTDQDTEQQKISVNYESMTLKELQNMAKQRGIIGVTTMKKGSIIEALKTSDRVLTSSSSKSVEPGSLPGTNSFLDSSAFLEQTDTTTSV